MTAIQEICKDMCAETGDDSLFLRIFRKHRGCTISGVDQEVRRVEHRQLRKEYHELTREAGGQHALTSTQAISHISKQYGISCRTVYRVLFHEQKVLT